MMSTLPEYPEFPSLEWEYEENGRYSLSETDVDKFLSYMENDIPLFLWEIEQYKKKLEVVTAESYSVVSDFINAKYRVFESKQLCL